MRWVRKLEIGIEEVILGLIILLNVFDAFEILPPDLDYVKKLISWSALAVMLVRARLDRVIAGQHDRFAAGLLITGFFLMTIKNLVGYAQSVAGEASSFLQPFYATLLTNANTNVQIGLWLGMLCVVIAAARLALRGIGKPSLSYALLQREDDGQRTFVQRWLILIAFSMLFFVGVFNILMEWLAIAIDAPLLMIGLAVFILHAWRGFSADSSLLSRFGSFGTSLYKRVIEELEYRHHLLHVAAVIVVLYGVTDALVFMWPMLFGIGDQLYLGSLPTLHLAFWQVVPLAGGMLEQVSGVLVVLANIFALGLVLLLPGWLWLQQTRGRSVRLPPLMNAVAIASLVITILAPSIRVWLLRDVSVFGLDIALRTPASVLAMTDVLLLGLAVGIAAELIAAKFRSLTQASVITIAMTCFCMYFLAYTVSVISYYLEILTIATGVSRLVLLLFFIATICISLAGLVGVVRLTWRQLHKHYSEVETAVL